MDWKAVVGGNVRSLRRARELTQEQLAGDVGIDLTYLGGIERGKRNPSLDVLIRISNSLRVDIRDLFADI